MKLKALIIDDEPLAHKVILKYANDVDFIEIVAQCHLATEALTILKEQSIDLLFLDINMPKLKGLDFLRVLQQKPLVIITSAYQEYALESFDLDVCDYLLKPFRFDRFLKAVNRAAELYALKNKPVVPPVSTIQSVQNDQLFIKVDKRQVQINPSDIYYLESYGNYVKVWSADSFLLTPQTLTAFESQLPANQFSRIHKSYIINRQYINFVEGNFVLLKNGQQLPIGKTQRATFKRFLAN